MTINHPDLTIPVYEKIKSLILNHELKPGQKIIQEKLANDLGVSRTPLRQALQKLEYEHLVESIPRRGMYVKKFSLEEIIDIFYCREGIEAMAARLTSEKRTQEELIRLEALFTDFSESNIDAEMYAAQDDTFHRLLVIFSKNKVLEKLYIQGNIHSSVIHIGLLRTPEETLQEHKDILTAIRNKDADMAEKHVRNHIRFSRERIEKELLNRNITKND